METWKVYVTKLSPKGTPMVPKEARWRATVIQRYFTIISNCNIKVCGPYVASFLNRKPTKIVKTLV